MPGSPETSTTWPSPDLARAQRRCNRSISSSRSTSRISVGPCNASNRLVTALGCSDSLDRYSTEIAIFEEVADQTARPVANNDRTGRGQGLQTGGEVGGLSDDRSLLCRSFTNQIADDHQSG